jgi:nucleoside 2-deoxyribosyltransferase
VPAGIAPVVIYLAGPEVFLPNAIAIGEAKKEFCTEQGLVGIFPLDGAAVEVGNDTTTAHAVFHRCVELMNRSDFIVANMTPFRGASMDVGTAVELGYMYALSSRTPGLRPRVFGYTNSQKSYKDRVLADGLAIEDYGLFDNLMCEGPVFESGGSVVRNEVRPEELFTDLAGFKECVLQIVDLLSSES